MRMIIILIALASLVSCQTACKTKIAPLPEAGTLPTDKVYQVDGSGELKPVADWKD